MKEIKKYEKPKKLDYRILILKALCKNFKICKSFLQQKTATKLKRFSQHLRSDPNNQKFQKYVTKFEKKLKIVKSLDSKSTKAAAFVYCKFDLKLNFDQIKTEISKLIEQDTDELVKEVFSQFEHEENDNMANYLVFYKRLKKKPQKRFVEARDQALKMIQQIKEKKEIKKMRKKGQIENKLIKKGEGNGNGKKESGLNDDREVIANTDSEEEENDKMIKETNFQNPKEGVKESTQEKLNKNDKSTTKVKITQDLKEKTKQQTEVNPIKQETNQKPKTKNNPKIELKEDNGSDLEIDNGSDLEDDVESEENDNSDSDQHITKKPKKDSTNFKPIESKEALMENIDKIIGGSTFFPRNRQKNEIVKVKPEFEKKPIATYPHKNDRNNRSKIHKNDKKPKFISKKDAPDVHPSYLSKLNTRIEQSKKKFEGEIFEI